ncbi:Scr1 family TA system antitoxin-like transcriptional regulator [Streptomyces composti]|uniref:Scr1 family TA system antitoxin-like transcriptional regulator n=1 Tax=Streptomyces composti TaxID=2720025 RepID=UPI00281166E4|nr:Scr1 family TA system antitoxin-like transcriptional regulator [Streptomyces composti]
MRHEQLRHLRESAGVPSIPLPVWPLGRTTHAWPAGPSILLATPGYQRLACAENLAGAS